MKGFRSTWIAILVAVSLALVFGTAFAKKGGNGKPGGGGGGGGGSTASGWMFVHTRWVEGGIWGQGWTDTAYRAINADGTVREVLEWPVNWYGSFGTSEHLHAGERVFCGLHESAPSSPLALVARYSDGSEVALGSAVDGLDPYACSFGGDDSFITFGGMLYHDNGERDVVLYWAPISWATDGMPSLDANPVVVLEIGINIQNPWASSGWSWSPNGTQLVYSVQGTLRVASFSLATGTPVLTGTSSYGTGGSPSWSPIDGSVDIAFADAGSIYRMKSDGSGRQELASPSRKSSLTAPQWSPDASHLVYRKLTNKKDSKFTISVTNLMVIPANGGEPTDISPADDGNLSHTVHGWRD